MTEVEKIAKGAKSATGTASNALDQLKKKVEKIENRKWDFGAIQFGENSSDKVRIICEVGTLVQVDTSSHVVVIFEGCPIWICMAFGLGWSKLNIFCLHEEGFKREWFKDRYTCIWYE